MRKHPLSSNDAIQTKTLRQNKHTKQENTLGKLPLILTLECSLVVGKC